ncbi:MAG: thioredoxin [Gemmatimonadetes bacterium]|nr:thioredoxin [Gemmatimonadota bacterium]
MAKPIDVTDGDFQKEVLEADLPVLVDFWAPWCGPCRIVSPVVEELAEEFDGRVKFTKVNVDSNPATAVKYGVRSIPTLLLLKHGKPVETIVGAVPKNALKRGIEEAIS